HPDGKDDADQKDQPQQPPPEDRAPAHRYSSSIACAVDSTKNKKAHAKPARRESHGLVRAAGAIDLQLRSARRTRSTFLGGSAAWRGVFFCLAYAVMERAH